MASAKQWVIAIQDLPPSPTSGNSNLETNIINLLHPRTGRKTPFLFVGSKLYELQTSYPMLGEELGYASWFVGDSVISDGSLLVATPIDPLFLAVSLLCTSNRMRPFDQLFISEKAPESKRIARCKNLDLKQICDVNDDYGPDSIFYRYNEEKTLQWLKAKVGILVRKLRKMGSALDDNNAHSGISKSFVIAGNHGPKGSQKDNGTMEAEDRKMKLLALRFISEYISNALLEKLSTTYKIPLAEISKKRRTAIRKSPTKPRPKPNTFDSDLDDLIRENSAPVNVQIASPPEAVGRGESTTSVDTVGAEPPQKRHQSKWEMQSEVSGDGLRGLLNIAPDLTTIGKKRSLNSVGSSAGMAKKSKPNPHLSKAAKGTKKLFAFFTKKKK